MTIPSVAQDMAALARWRGEMACRAIPITERVDPTTGDRASPRDDAFEDFSRGMQAHRVLCSLPLWAAYTLWFVWIECGETLREGGEVLDPETGNLERIPSRWGEMLERVAEEFATPGEWARWKREGARAFAMKRLCGQRWLDCAEAHYAMAADETRAQKPTRKPI